LSLPSGERDRAMPEPLLNREVKCVDWGWLPAKS
jgi:hypothetical protein